MKAALVLFCVGLTSVVCNNGQDKIEARKDMMKTVAECKRGNISDERMRVMLRHEVLPETKDEKCTGSCILLKDGFIKDGQINPEEWKKNATIKWDDPSVPDKVAKSAKSCQNKDLADSDPCEMSNKVLECIFKANIENGVPPPDFPE